jgi:hypothetical protein
MRQANSQRARWVKTEAAKHTTPQSIRQRIADEEKHIRVLLGASVTSGSTEEALEAHRELIQVLTKRLADLSSR